MSMIDAFRAEIVSAENNRMELLKWKLIIVAVLGAVGLGIGQTADTACPNSGTTIGNPDTAMNPILILSLIPFVSTYVDLLCKHLQLRILVISEFFQRYKCKEASESRAEIMCLTEYEQFCRKVRRLFNFEDFAQIGSTVVISVLIIITPFVMKYSHSNTEYSFLILSGSFGLLSSLIISCFYKWKIDSLENSNENT